ncbi:hypothetical protein T261_2224 [Streptomyces lydicus]|nr:hypothetical protein T261_2224 [Streptomyces lydicus]
MISHRLALFWDSLEYVAGEDFVGLAVPECSWDADLLMWRPPETVSALKQFWAQAAPDLNTLREPFAEHAAVPEGWIRDFGAFAELLWGGMKSSSKPTATGGASSGFAADPRSTTRPHHWGVSGAAAAARPPTLPDPSRHTTGT